MGTDSLGTSLGTTSGTFQLVGADGSPYSCKLRAALRFGRIAFRWRPGFELGLQEGGRMWDEHFPELRARVIPVLVRPDGSYANDSTPLLQELVGALPDPARHWRRPSAGEEFLSLALEDFADEWGTKVMFAGRFATQADAEFGAGWQMWQNPGMPASMREAAVAFFAERQRERRAVVGCPDWAPMERTLREMCQILTNMVVAGQPFLFGSRPSAADFGLYGQLRQLAIDPMPSRVVHEFPAAWAWVWRMDDLSGYEVGEVPGVPGRGAEGQPGEKSQPKGGASPAAAAAVDAMLRLAGQTYLPFLLANDAALRAGEQTVRSPLFGGALPQHEQPPFKYQQRCLRLLRERFAELGPADQAFVDASFARADTPNIFATGLDSAVSKL